MLKFVMSRRIRKPKKCLGENKRADQLCSNYTADQRLCFLYTDSDIPLLLQSEISSLLSCFCDCTSQFLPDLVGNPNCCFSHAKEEGEGYFVQVGGQRISFRCKAFGLGANYPIRYHKKLVIIIS